MAFACGSNSTQSPSPPPTGPPPSSGSSLNVYVSPSGSAGNSGSRESPIDLDTALSSRSPVQPGGTVWLLGGVYKGGFTSQLAGRADAPIVVRAAPGERPILDGANPTAIQRGIVLIVQGAYTWFWGLEFTYSDPDRVDTGRPSGPNGVYVNESTGIKLIDNVVHDLPGQAFGLWAENNGAEAYGNVIFYNGTNSFDHGIYTQNANGTKQLRDNVIFQQASHGIHAFGSSAVSLDHYDIEGNVSFNNGLLIGEPARNLLVGGGRVADDLIVKQNYTYYPLATPGGSNNLGYVAGCTNATVTDNYFVGPSALALINCAPAPMTGNVLVGSWEPLDMPARFPGNTFSRSLPSGLQVIVRKNQYEPGRATIVVYNWDLRGDVGVDLSQAGVTQGARFEIRDVQNLFGTPLVSGTVRRRPGLRTDDRAAGRAARLAHHSPSAAHCPRVCRVPRSAPVSQRLRDLHNMTNSTRELPVTSGTAYDEADLLAALRAGGIAEGDILFVHASLDALGPGASGEAPGGRPDMVLRALRAAVGTTGTLLVPTYTFSFCRRDPFDPDATATSGGPWSESADFLEHVRQQPGVVRSSDPIHSVTALGPEAHALLGDLPPTCFGVDSVQHRLRRRAGKICMIGVDVHESTMVHHAEVMAQVPFRFRKLFTGERVHRGNRSRAGWICEVRVLAPNTELEPRRINQEARRRGLVRSVPVGRGAVHVVEAPAFYDFLEAELAADPWFTVKGPADDPLRLERQRIGPTIEPVTLPPDASIEAIVDSLWGLRRDIVSDGYDAALVALQSQVPMRVHEDPMGTECSTWIVPEQWTCHEAWLETMDGRRLFTYADNPLHVVSYSLPYDGVVPRAELLAHLHVHDRLPHAVPFIFKYDDRDWGLCCSRQLRDSLADDEYRVVIRTSFSYGTLKVGEVVARGSTDETIVFCAHLCHPGMAVDDLSGVAVGIDVMRALRRRTNLRYTYRLLILPETIGSIAYLSDHQALVPLMKGGLFLEMLGLPHPHVLQGSFAGDTEVDACFSAALQSSDHDGWTTPYRTMPGNDERQFNAPGVRVPMLSLLRVLPTSSDDHPYRDDHSSDDTPAVVSGRRLEESRDLVLRMVDVLESNRVPINRFIGEVCCSRYGLNIDYWENPEAHRALFRTMDLIDGTRSAVQIAAACGVRVEAVQHILAELQRRDLIAYREGNPGTSTVAPDAGGLR